MAISTNGTVIARLAGGLYNTVMSNATYLEVAAQDPSALANTLYARDFAKSTDLAVATTLITNLGLSTVAGLDNWVAAQLTAAGSAGKGAKIVSLLNDFAGMTADATYGTQATAFNTKVDAALAASQKTGAVEGKFATAGVVAVANATFALTTGTDTWTGGAGDDSVTATVATLGDLDVIDASTGADTLTITDTAAIASLSKATLSGFETVKISSSGAVGAVAAAAGTNTAAAQQVATVVLTGTFVATDTVTVKIGDATYTEAIGTVTATDYAGRAEAAAKIKSIIEARTGDTVTVAAAVHDTGTAGTASTFVETAFTITSNTGGTALPITVSKGTVASTTATIASASATATQTADLAAKTVTANAVPTAPVAVKEVKVLTLGDANTATSLTVSINGTDYTGTPTGSTKALLAADVARIVNSVLGTGVAVAGTDNVTITAPTAGTALPLLNVSMAATTAASESWATVVVNKVANAAAASAAAIAAPTGTTAYTVSAGGVANVSAPTTSTVDVTGTAVKSSGGSTVKVTASDSVHVLSAVGAVTVKTGAVTTSSTTLVGAVRSDTGSSTAGDAKGVYVTGGTTVDITVSGTNTQAIKVGAAAYSKDAVNETTFPKTNGNIAFDPTGNVSITGVTGTKSTTTGKTDAAFSTGTASVYTNGGSTVTVKGAGTTVITDQATFGLRTASTDTADTYGTSTLTTVNLAGLSGNATITSDAISTVSVADTLTARTVTVANSGKVGANAGAINFAVSNLGGSAANVTLKNDTATTVNVSSAAATTYDSIGGTEINKGSKSFIVLDTAKATTVAFSNSNSVALAASTLTVATAINATGSGALDLGTVGSVTSGASTVKVTSIDASGASGAVTVSLATTVDTSAQSHSLSFKGGSGADKVTLTGDMKSGTNSAGAVVQNTIDLGAGNDSLLKNGGSIAAGSSVNGGDGSDTIAASLLTAGNAAQITGFEVLGLDLTTGSYDTDLLANATGLAMLARGATYTNVEQAQGLSVVTGKATADATDTTTVSFTASTVTGTADAYTVSFAQSASTSTATARTISDAGVVVLAGIETINVASGGSGFLDNYLTVTGANARNVTLTGDQNLDIDFSANFGGTTAATASNGLGVATIDGSAMTGKLTVNTANVLEAWTTTTVKGGSNSDTITLSALGGKAVVESGAGNDKIVVAAQSSKLTGGAGNDTFDVTLAVAMSGGTATTYVTEITDFAAGDVLDFIGGTNGTHSATSSSFAKLTLTTEASVDAAIIAALNLSPKATAAAKEVTWFVYGANTYVVFDASDDDATNGGMANGDIVVKLAGVLDLANATFDATNGSLTIPV